ncbi:hypothetical protein [Hymenobacter sp. BRD67]|uniref:hypothetical protein n=1 Tax=Hymenobacter sp. BRD67 TaxID=2675877 RepID=UPI0015650D8E|nr:hypothetical protein [Hymenobacter sp. BRD67]QKG54293.1 hypothetical protein GKZ67_18945 [Hymenobacter sp. BRD67]
MKKDLHNIFGKVSLSIEYDRANHLIYNDWQGYQTLESIMLGPTPTSMSWCATSVPTCSTTIPT